MKKTLSVFLLFAAACGRVEAPAPLFPVPNARQLAWQQLETYAFVHYGLNTFNDMEWGYGDTPASTFDPADLDCDQWVRTFRAAGMKGVMLTAKHHDGFCLWPSAYTEYSVKNSPWRGGKGDLVRELSDACRRHGLKFGIYISPWDRNHPEYGREEYVAYFHNQMRELLTGYGPLFEYWFDGANGGDGWYGGADEKRSIDAKTYYGYERARRTINELQPEAVIFGGTCADIRWIGNEEGRAGQTNWSMVKGRGDERLNDFTCGEFDGDTWLPGECDVSIRPGWFYHPREDHQLKSLSRLIDIYYESVGRNANLLLNFPVDRSGRIAPADSARIMEWRRALDAEFAHDLLAEAQATADTVRDGWLHTGDMGYLTDDGFLYVLGRFKSLLIASDGEKYSPEGMEEAIADASRLIDQIIVHNNQNPYTVAIVVPNRDELRRRYQTCGNDLVALAREVAGEIDAFRAGGVHAGEFPDRWLPSAVAIVDEAFTEQNGLVNSTMKVVRSRVEEHFRDRLDALYTPEGKRPDSAQNLASLKKLVE